MLSRIAQNPSIRFGKQPAPLRTGLLIFSFHSADRPTPETFTTLNRTPGISPFAFPLRPKPARRSSSFSSTKLRQQSLGTNAVTFFPFLINWTLTHFRMAELGCLASTPTFSRTMPLAWEDPPNGDDLKAVPRARFLYERSAHFCSRRWLWSLRAALRPRGFPLPMIAVYGDDGRLVVELLVVVSSRSGEVSDNPM